MENEDSKASASVTRMLQHLQEGDENDANDLFNFYFERLVLKARKELSRLGRVRIQDEEDLASKVLTKFILEAKNGKFMGITSREDGWRILFDRINKRAKNHIRDELRAKQLEVGESAVNHFKDIPNAGDLGDFNNHCESWVEQQNSELLLILKDPVEIEIFQLTLEGLDVDAIALRIGRSRATVYRKLGRIKEILQRDQSHDPFP